MPALRGAESSAVVLRCVVTSRRTSVTEGSCFNPAWRSLILWHTTLPEGRVGTTEEPQHRRNSSPAPSSSSKPAHPYGTFSIFRWTAIGAGVCHLQQNLEAQMNAVIRKPEEEHVFRNVCRPTLLTFLDGLSSGPEFSTQQQVILTMTQRQTVPRGASTARPLPRAGAWSQRTPRACWGRTRFVRPPAGDLPGLLGWGWEWACEQRCFSLGVVPFLNLVVAPGWATRRQAGGA